MPLKLFNGRPESLGMDDIFDSIPLLAVLLFTLGLVGVIAYEKTRTKAE